MPREIFVALDGDDRHDGSSTRPLRHINRAAELARPGDCVTVRAGVYREWVRPHVGGESDARRITFRATPGEDVVITGSEVVDTWQHHDGDVWKATLDDATFSGGNPFRDRLGGDWFYDKGRTHHTGDVFLDGVSLFEVSSLAEVMNPQPYADAYDPQRATRAWYVKDAADHVVVYANFGGADPREHLVEVTVRPAVFFPRRTGVNYITVRGFELRHAATPWAPPTAEQIGLIGPHWAKGWIIEDNYIHDARCSGISLGKEGATGQNLWTERRIKHGTQRERETVFQALRIGWSRDTVGSHVVRNNRIHDCEQTGICGHLGCIFSEITGNHIHDIHVKRQFTGAEIAGIKLHAAIDTLIAGNRIHNCGRGIWLDWQAQGARVRGNLLYEHFWEDFFIEVTHGPCVVDHNIMLSANAIRNVAQGTAFAHNLIVGRTVQQPVPNRFTFYHFPHSTAVAGLMTILGGDDRCYNNLFVPSPDAVRDASVQHTDDANTDFANARRKNEGHGTAIYDGFPIDERQWETARTPDDYAALKLPVFIGHNGYAGGATAWEYESGAVVRKDLDPRVRLSDDGDTVTLHLTLDDALCEKQCPMVTGGLLGQAFEPEAAYETHDSRALRLDRDYVDKAWGQHPGPGPLAGLQPGAQAVVVWPLRPTDTASSDASA